MRRFAPFLALGFAALVPAAAAAQRRPPTHSTTVALYRNDSRLLVVNKDSNSLAVLAVRKGKADLQQKLAEVGVGSEPRCVALGTNDFNNGNARDVQGGKGFAGEPPNDIFNHGRTQGISEALDLETLWVQTIRPLNRPQPVNPEVGRAAFEANCASCHGGAKWTKSQTIYLNNPTFDRNPIVAGAVKFDPFLPNVGLELISYQIGANLLTLLDPVGTFDAANPLEIRNNAAIALGGRGFKASSLNGIGHSAPYFHDGSARTLDEVFGKHLLPGGGTIAATLPGDVASLETFLASIDGGTPTFDSDTDRFLDAIVP